MKQHLIDMIKTKDIEFIQQALLLNEQVNLIPDIELSQLLAESHWNYDSLNWYILNNLKEHHLRDTNTVTISSLHSNRFNKGLFTLEKLKSLCSVTGELEILDEQIGNLTELVYLELAGNQLTRIPESIGNLKELECFELEDNQITSLPESFGNLTNLAFIDLDYNSLQSIPESFGNLTKLEMINISYNQLTRLPDSIANLKELHRLNAYNNNFSDTEKERIRTLLAHVKYINL